MCEVLQASLRDASKGSRYPALKCRATLSRPYRDERQDDQKARVLWHSIRMKVPDLRFIQTCSYTLKAWDNDCPVLWDSRKSLNSIVPKSTLRSSERILVFDPKGWLCNILGSAIDT